MFDQKLLDHPSELLDGFNRLRERKSQTKLTRQENCTNVQHLIVQTDWEAPWLNVCHENSPAERSAPDQGEPFPAESHRCSGQPSCREEKLVPLMKANKNYLTASKPDLDIVQLIVLC